jgi:hypothetical protein
MHLLSCLVWCQLLACFVNVCVQLEDKLAEFDVDGDGQLTEFEIELQQPNIQKYLNRYNELLQEAEEEEEEEKREEEEQTAEAKHTQRIKDERNEQAGKHSEQNPEAKADNSGQNVAADNKKTEDSAKMTGAEFEQKPTVPDKHAEPRIEDDDDDDGVEIEVVDEMELVTEDEVKEEGFSTLVLTAIVGGAVLFSVGILWMADKTQKDWLKKKQKQEGRHLISPF